MDRRRFLQAGAAALVPAVTTGCLGGDGPGTSPDDETPDGSTPTTDEPTSDEPTTDGTTSPPGDEPSDVGDYVAFGDGSVVVHEMVAQKSLFHAIAPDAIGVAGENEQYLCVRVECEGVSPDRDAFAVSVDDWTASPASDYSFHRMEIDGRDVTVYDPEEGTGWLVFSFLPSLEPDGATVSVEVGGKRHGWAIPSAAQAVLRSPAPSLAVESFHLPEDVHDGRVPAEVTVRNDGDEAATFRGAINASGPGYAPVATFRLSVPGGETRTWSGTFEPFGTVSGEHQYSLQYVGGSASETVELTHGEPTTTVAAEE